MNSPLIDKKTRKSGEAGLNPLRGSTAARSTALPVVYLLTLAAFVVVAGSLISAGQRFNRESVVIQKQVKTLGEQQLLSERLKTIVAGYGGARANRAYLNDELREAIAQMKAVIGRLEMFSESPELAALYSDDIKFYLDELRQSWSNTQIELARLDDELLPSELLGIQHTCDQLLRSGSYVMQESLSAQHANQGKRTTLLYIFAASLALLGLIMLWSLWSASSNRMEIMALNLQLEQRVGERTAELEKTNMFLSNVQSSICSALVVVDTQNRVVTWNPAAAKLWGVPRAQAEGRDLFSTVPLENSEEFHAALLEVQRSAQTQFLKEVLMQDATGQQRCGNASLVPMLGPLRELRGVVILVDDVTERVQARRELADQATEIADANRTLKRVNNDMEQFVYAASHDLRSPLVNMSGLTRKLDTSFQKVSEQITGNGNDNGDGGSVEAYGALQGVLEHDIPKLIFRLHRSISKFGSIIDGLLHYSRTGREKYHLRDIDMAQEVAKVVELCAGTIEEKGVQIYVDDLPNAHGDTDAINKVLSNLVGNALQYLDPDRDGELVIEGKALDDGMCMYFVRDNGVGIREGDVDQVFKIFERLNSVDSEGDGLGLAIVKKIVERHGGEISVESHWGEGSTFWFTLPAAFTTAQTVTT